MQPKIEYPPNDIVEMAMSFPMDTKIADVLMYGCDTEHHGTMYWNELVEMVASNDRSTLNDLVGFEVHIFLAENIFEHRWSELEDMLIDFRHPGTLLNYTRRVIKARWDRAEKDIMKVPHIAVQYAEEVIHGRWEQAEDIIATMPAAAVKYAARVIGSRWKDGEDIILTSRLYTYKYFDCLMRHEWPEGAAVLKSNDFLYDMYNDVLEGVDPRRELLDDIIAQHGNVFDS